MDGLAARLLQSFRTELDEHLLLMDHDLSALQREPEDVESLRSLFRSAHTLKGAGRAAGVPLVERLCHALETRLAGARDGRQPLAAEDFVVLFRASAALADVGERLRAGEPSPEAGHEDLVATLAGGDAPQEDRLASPSAVVSEEVGPSRGVVESTASPLVRVSGQKLDRLQAAAASLLLERARLQAHADRATTEADSAESRDVRQLRREALRIAEDARAAARGLARASDDIIHTAREVRLRPFEEACEHLPRAARDLAAGAGKEVVVRLDGGGVEVDRSVLDGLRQPLLQLVRNAVGHGIEAPSERVAAGKPAGGTIRIEARDNGDRLTVRVSDDGGGLDLAALRDTLRRRGLAPPDDEEALIDTLLQGGVSTRGTADVLSGRGVGLDIVRDAVAKMRGTVRANSALGQGTTFTIDVPVSLATATVVLARVQSWTVAFPATYVQRLLRPDPDHLRRSNGQHVLLTEDGTVPLAPLARVLGRPFQDSVASEGSLIVLLRSGRQRAAVLVDDLVGAKEIVVGPVAHAGAAVPLVTGATTLANGEVVPVLDVSEVLRAVGLASLASAPSPRVEPKPETTRRRVLVVDDSITTRTLVRSVLESGGYDVLTAADGAEAWERLRAEDVELVVADVEMPLMDGFELCRTIRATARTRDLPVILVTGRESPQDRQTGLEAGADVYMAKSAFEQAELLETARQLVG